MLVRDVHSRSLPSALARLTQQSKVKALVPTIAASVSFVPWNAATQQPRALNGDRGHNRNAVRYAAFTTATAGLLGSGSAPCNKFMSVGGLTPRSATDSRTPCCASVQARRTAKNDHRSSLLSGCRATAVLSHCRTQAAAWWVCGKISSPD